MSINFTGRYRINANQNMATQYACLKRDTVVGFWINKSKNGEAIYKQLKDFYLGEYNANPLKPLDVIFDIPNSEDKNFETSMNIIGQKFRKLA